MEVSWFPFNKIINKQKPILFCFHYAGGTASVFSRWIRESKKYEIIPIELPGKGIRYKEKFATDIKDFINDLSKEIIKVIEEAQKDFYFYGHSMGAAMAFYIAYHLQENNLKIPKALIVSGRQAPQDPNYDEGIGYLSDEAIKNELIRVGGTPKEILENKEVMSFFMPSIRADYQLNDSFKYRNEKINCSIVANCGSADKEADYEVMSNWRAVTNNKFVIKDFEGDHFFPFNKDEYIKYLDLQCKD